MVGPFSRTPAESFLPLACAKLLDVPTWGPDGDDGTPLSRTVEALVFGDNGQDYGVEWLRRHWRSASRAGSQHDPSGPKRMTASCGAGNSPG